MLNALFYPKVPYNHRLFDNLYFPHILDEIHIKGVYREIFEGKKDLIVVDAGANCGLVTQYFREYAKQVYAIEPSPEHFEALKKNKEFNEWDNVAVINAGLFGADGEAEVYTNRGNLTMNSLTANYNQGGTKIKTITLETLMKENEIDEIDFLKMDIEGSEYPIIKSEGFKRVLPKIKAMVVEFHPWANNNEDYRPLVEIITSAGFTTKQEEVSTINIQFFRKEQNA